MDDPVNDSVTDEQLAPEREQALADLRRVFDGSDLEWSEVSPTSLMVTLPGERKQQTPCRFDVGRHALEVHAFVCRKPDENFEGVYRWLLERNMKMYAVSFGLDPMGDIYLDARLPLAVLDPDELDRLLGSVLSAADESFNTILELGFSTAIRKEWDWRRSRGEPTHNLEAFRGWLESGDDSAAGEDEHEGDRGR